MVSVIVPAFNEEKCIATCLNALQKQVFIGEYEVILVDNGSTDNTKKIAKQFLDKMNLRIISEVKKGRGAARWRGFREAKGDVLLSTDADTVVPKTWIHNLVVSLNETNVDAITGTSTIVDCGRIMNPLYNASQPVIMRSYRLLFGHYWLSGFNFAIRKDAYLKSGGFDYELNGLEDVDLAFKVSKVGKIHYDSSIPVQFSGRRFQNGVAIGYYQYTKSFVDYFFLKRKNVVLSDVR